jgi:hypothetical protein
VIPRGNLAACQQCRGLRPSRPEAETAIDLPYAAILQHLTAPWIGEEISAEALKLRLVPDSLRKCDRMHRLSNQSDAALVFAGSGDRCPRVFQIEEKLTAAKNNHQRRRKHDRGKQQRRHAGGAGPSRNQPAQTKVDGNNQ